MALGQTAELLFKIKADNSQADRALNDTKEEIQGFGDVLNSLGGKAGLSTNAMAGAGAAFAAFGAIAAAQVRFFVDASVGLFNLAKSASDAGSEIYDAQAKTGLTASTLTALKLAADNAGSSFDGITASAAKFNVLLGAANQGNEKAIATLDQYGIKSRDLNGALNEAIKVISNETDATKQAAMAKDLFKDKTGSLLPVIQQMSGNLAEFEKEAERLGTTLSDKDTQAADDFGDALGLLSAQVSTASQRFALEFAPAVTRAMSAISQAFANNQEVARIWGSTIADVLYTGGAVARATGQAIGGILDFVGIRFSSSASRARFWAEAILAAFNPILALAARLGAIFNKNAGAGLGGDFDPSRAPIAMPAIKAGGGGGGGGGGVAPKGGGGASDAEAKRRAELDAQLEAQKIALRRLEAAYTDTMKRIRAAFKENDDQGVFSQESLDAVQLYVEGVAKVRAEMLRLDDALGSKDTDSQMRIRLMKQWDEAKKLSADIRRDHEENNLLKTASDVKRAEDARKIFEQLAKDELAADQSISRSLQNNTEQELQATIEANAEIIRSATSTKDQQAAAQDAITNAAIKANAVLMGEAARVRDNALEQLDIEQAERRRHIQETIKDEDKKLAALEALDNLYKRRRLITLEAFEAEKKRIEESVGSVPVIAPGEEKKKSLGLIDDPDKGGLGKELDDLRNGALSSFANGLGSIVEQWVLLGKVGPDAMRKLTASVLAGLAAQAAVKSLFYLAEGIAALWWNPVQAAGYFKASAIMAGVAGAAAVAGRAIAGDSFNQATGGGARNEQGDGRPQNGTLASGGAVRLGEGNRAQGGLYGRIEEMMERHLMVTAQAEETNRMLANRIGTVSPGVLVAQGADENPQAIANGMNKAIEDGGSFAADKMMRSLGFAT